VQIEHLAQFDVIGKLAAASQQAILFFARKRFAYPVLAVSPGTHLLVLRFLRFEKPSSCARWTAGGGCPYVFT